MAEILAISKDSKPNRLGDVVFIHGLDGDANGTWQIKDRADTFWPAWLADDLKDFAVWSLGYEASSTTWKGHALPLAERATNVLATLDSVGLGNRPTVFIAHSLGGLVIKQALRRATDFGSPPAWVSIAKSTRGIVFLATPHQGSQVASFIHRAAHLLPGVRATPLIDDLRADSPQLRDLNNWYRSAAKHLGIQTQIYYEGKTIGPLTVVDAGSGDAGVEDVIAIPMDNDHVSICKPVGRTAMLYRRVLAFVAGATKSPVAAGVPPPTSAAHVSGSRANPRVVRIFISCPGDLALERERIEAAVRRVSSAFAPHAIHLATWRYDLDAVPSLGTDAQQAINSQIPKSYDIYVGIMCRRFGSATYRYASGTLEEFESARDGWEKERKPRVLFYFCKGAAPVGARPEDINQHQAVESFRHRYPGLFASFTNLDDLGVQFERHLVACVLDLVLPSSPPSGIEPDAPLGDGRIIQPSQGSQWFVAAADAVDKATTETNGRFDYSSQRPSRIIAKIERLFDCDRLLTAIEREILFASLHLRTAAVSNQPDLRQAVIDAIPASIGVAACEITALAGAAPALSDFSVSHQWAVPIVKDASSVSKFRSPLLAALLRLGELLDLDQAGLSTFGRTSGFGVVSPQSAERVDVLRATLMTYEIRVQLNVVTFVLTVASPQWIDFVKRCTALRIEAEWQRSRAMLSREGFVFAVAPSEVVVASGIQPPANVMADLQSLGDSILAEFQPLVHFGDRPKVDKTEAPRLSHLLPLPDSATMGDLVVPLNPGDYDHVLILRRIAGSGQAAGTSDRKTRLHAAAGEDSIVLRAEFFSDGGEFRWTLYRDYYDGYLKAQATGALRLVDRHIALTLLIEDQLDSAERLARLAAAELWNDWLLAIWPQLIDRTATAEDTAKAFGVLSSAFEQNERSGEDGEARVDAYRNAVNWIEDLLAHPKPHEVVP